MSSSTLTVPHARAAVRGAWKRSPAAPPLWSGRSARAGRRPRTTPPVRASRSPRGQVTRWRSLRSHAQVRPSESRLPPSRHCSTSMPSPSAVASRRQATCFSGLLVPPSTGTPPSTSRVAVASPARSSATTPAWWAPRRSFSPGITTGPLGQTEAMTDIDVGATMVTRADIEAAREVLGDVARLTPVETSRPLSERVGGPVALKCENLQRTGSFKIRGAYVRIARLSDAERAGGVVAASAGNHAQGVALAADLLGTKATIFMPEGAPLPKVAATRAYGADVQLVGASVDETLVAAKQYSEENGAIFVHPFDHPDIIAGQGTVGLELLEQAPDARTVVVPVGGGGLISGIAAGMRGARSDLTIIGVQAEGAASYPPSLAAGHPITLPSCSTIADGIAVGHPGKLTFPH